MDDFVDSVVVGAGVIGLAIARALALSGREVLVLEAASSFGTQTSSRNSEVIHAGIYYEPGSLKARLCVAGKARLYDYCEARGVGHRRCGKLIVATDAGEADRLEGIRATAAQNGVEDLEWHDAAQVRARSPAVRAEAALWSPSTGIVDSHGLMSALLADASNAGATVVYETRVAGGELDGPDIVIEAAGVRVGCRELVNAAGLGAQAVASSLRGLPAATIPPRYMAKGTYFTATGSPRFDCLVYPVPATASLGIHVTIDLAGQVRFGPDQEWVEAVDYRVDPGRAAACEADVRRYLELPDGARFTPTYAGIRSKIQAPDQPKADFVLSDAREHGVAGLVSLYGMESPGLTACLAIADEVVRRLTRA